jgi:hypothetical protein
VANSSIAVRPGRRQTMPSRSIDSCTKADLARLRRRPHEAAAVHPLGKQAQALAIIPEELDQIAALAAEGEQRVGMRTLTSAL